MTSQAYPRLTNLLGAWFHQDYDLDGENVKDIIAAYGAVTPAVNRAELEAEIDAFIANHPHDLEESFERTFRPELDVASFSGSVRKFLEEVHGLLGEP